MNFSVRRIYKHFSVAITFLPLSFFITLSVPYLYNGGIETLQMLLGGGAEMSQKKSSIYNSSSGQGDGSASKNSPFRLANLFVTIDDQISFLDTQAVACLLLCQYGFVILATHLVNIVRYLKISKRRLQMETCTKSKVN